AVVVSCEIGARRRPTPSLGGMSKQLKYRNKKIKIAASRSAPVIFRERWRYLPRPCFPLSTPGFTSVHLTRREDLATHSRSARKTCSSGFACQTYLTWNQRPLGRI